MNESYATAITMNNAYHGKTASEIASSPVRVNYEQSDPIDEYPSAKLKQRASAPLNPSRFNLNMYKKSMLLEAPKRNAATLRWDSLRQAASSEKKCR